MRLKSPFETIIVDKLNNRDTTHTITRNVKSYIQSEDNLELFFCGETALKPIITMNFENEKIGISTKIRFVESDNELIFQEKINNRLYYYRVNVLGHSGAENVSPDDAINRFILSNSKNVLSIKEKELYYEKMNDLILAISDKYKNVKFKEEDIPFYDSDAQWWWSKFSELDELMSLYSPDYNMIHRTFRNSIKNDPSDFACTLIDSMNYIERDITDRQQQLSSFRALLIDEVLSTDSSAVQSKGLLNTREVELSDLIREYERLKYFTENYMLNDDVTEDNFYSSISKIKAAPRNSFVFRGEKISLSKLDVYF